MAETGWSWRDGEGFLAQTNQVASSLRQSARKVGHIWWFPENWCWLLNIDRSFSQLTAYEASRILSRLGASRWKMAPRKRTQKCWSFEHWVNGQMVSCGAALSSIGQSQPFSRIRVRQCTTLAKLHNFSWTTILHAAVDWIPLSLGSVRPTQGRTLAVCRIEWWFPVLQYSQPPPTGWTLDENVDSEFAQCLDWLPYYNRYLINLLFRKRGHNMGRRIGWCIMPSSNRDKLVGQTHLHF